MNGVTKNMEIKGTLERNPHVLVHSEESSAKMGTDAKGKISRDLTSMFYVAKLWKINFIYSSNVETPDWYGNTWSHT